MHPVRTALAGAVALASLVLGASAAAAQTTTTVPPVPAIPVTDGTTATTTAASSGTSGELAETGVAADLLVPFAFGLIGGGAVLQAAARRRSRNAYGLL